MVFGKFNERAQLVLVEAQKESQYFKHGYIGTEHILLGILKEGGYAKQVLYVNGATIDKVKRLIEDYLGFGDIDISVGEMLLNPRTKRLFDDSLIKARMYDHKYINPEHILLALIDDTEGIAYTMLSNLKLDLKFIKNEISDYLYKKEAEEIKIEDKNKRKSIKTPLLNQYGRNLTDMAREGSLDPVIGRESENKRILEILCRRIKNNPCLIGEPGVGKTAVIEGLAQRIISGNVPDILKDKILISLDLTSMVAGSKYRGEFEDRLKKVIDEIRSSQDIIIFIDEIHTIVGAGGAEGAIDAANILKPALARGEIKCIGATTIDEYRKYIEKDSALERRFQPVIIEEPSKEETLEILKGLREKYELHHMVRIEDEALEAAVDLSDRYITDRFMPDKAIDLIDEASAKVRIENLISPPDIKELQIKIKEITREKEMSIKNQDFERAAYLRDKEKELISNLDDLKINLNNNESNSYVVNKEQVARVVSIWSRIPLEKLTEQESEKLLKLEDLLHKRVVGQKEAVMAVAKAVRRARVGLKDPNRPIGTFVFCGPTGVGKTELSNALAEAMFGDKKNLIRIDMSEYMEKHSVSRLVGAPPGYVGYDEGGQLTEAVRRNPYSVILFDEIEKAHEDVFNIFLQILDDGRLTDNKGKTVDFKNTIIIMTSNIGSSYLLENKSEEIVDDSIRTQVENEMKLRFKPEFLNRVDDIIMFKPLSENGIKKIIDIFLRDVVNRLKDKNITLKVTDSAKTMMAKEGYDPVYGARPLKRYIQNTLENNLARKIIKGEIGYGSNVIVDILDDKIIIE